MNLVRIRAGGGPGGEKSLYKGPEAGLCLAGQRKNREDCVAGAE